MKTRALILVAHGSPDPDWAAPLRKVVETMAKLDADADVELALLTESDSLNAAISRLRDRGHQQLEVVSALLSAGGRHLKRDIPAWVEEARAGFPELRIDLRPGALGAEEAVITALAKCALNAGN
jgi:sirohydrochlorin cobaltochelatase